MEKIKLALELKTTIFHSPTYGDLSPNVLLEKVNNYLKSEPEAKYRLIIGSDSQPRTNGQTTIDYVTALIVHRIGSGGIYFWTRTPGPKLHTLRERIYTEALLSLKMAEDFLGDFERLGILKYDLEIHVDIGNVGETRSMIAEVTGMIRANGFNVKTKPESFGASKVADRHT